MFKLLVLLSLAAYASAGGLYSGLGTLGYGSGYGYGYGGYGPGSAIYSYAPSVSYAPYATSYANTIKSVYPSYYSGYYPSVKRILYANPLNKLGYYSPSYLGGYAGSYSPYYSNYYNDYGYGYGYGSGLGLGHAGYYGGLGGISAYGHNIYNHY